MSLVLHYKFNEPDPAIDSSGNSTSLVNAGGVTSTIDVTYGTVASFDGTADAYLTLDTPPNALTGSSPRTISYWVKRNNTSVIGVVHGAGTSDQSGRFLAYFPVGSIKFNHVQIATSIVSVSGTFGADIWYHCVATYDGTTFSVYVGGVLAGSSLFSLDTTTNAFAIGRGLSLTTGVGFDGSICDFRVYDYALTPESASNLYNAGPNPSFTLTPWSTLVDVSWNSISNAVSYKLTIDSGSGESTVSDNITSVRHVVYNLVPDTAYTVALYHSADGSTYSMVHTETTTTLPDTSANANLAIFLSNGIYDLGVLNDETLSLLEKHINDVLTTGDEIYVDEANLNGKKLTVIGEGATSSIPDSKAVLFPFSASGGSSQTANLELSDGTTVAITYDDSTNRIDVAGVTYSSGDIFVLDGKKTYVYDV